MEILQQQWPNRADPLPALWIVNGSAIRRCIYRFLPIPKRGVGGVVGRHDVFPGECRKRAWWWECYDRSAVKVLRASIWRRPRRLMDSIQSMEHNGGKQRVQILFGISHTREENTSRLTGCGHEYSTTSTPHCPLEWSNAYDIPPYRYKNGLGDTLRR
jgi:hypothetical protein